MPPPEVPEPLSAAEVAAASSPAQRLAWCAPLGPVAGAAGTGPGCAGAPTVVVGGAVGILVVLSMAAIAVLYCRRRDSGAEDVGSPCSTEAELEETSCESEEESCPLLLRTDGGCSSRSPESAMKICT